MRGLFHFIQTSSITPRASIGWLIAGLFAIFSLPTLTSLVQQWETNPDYGHGWLLLPLTVYLYVRTRPWHDADAPCHLQGTAFLLLGGVLHLATLLIPLPLVDYAGWFLMLLGTALSLGGRAAACRTIPVLCFGILMFPLPAPWLNTSAMLLQDLVAMLTEWVVSCFSVCLRRGHLLYLAGLDEPVSVAVECSGIRQVLVFVALAWGMSFFLNGSLARKFLLVLASIPMAIVANLCRVLALTLIARFYGTASIKGVLHDLPLLITLPIGGVLLWSLFRVLQTTNIESHPTNKEVSSQRNLLLPVLPLTVLLGCQWALQWHVHQVQVSKVDAVSIADLPGQLGPWNARSHPEYEQVKAQSTFADDMLLRAYVNDRGQAAAVYLVYSSRGEDRLHHPEICLRDAGGAIEIKRDRKAVSLAADTTIHAERFRYIRNRQTTTVYYWHYTLMPHETDSLTMLQRIYLKQQNGLPSITVQVQTNMNDPAALQAIETTLLPVLHAKLLEQLPGKAIPGSTRLSVRFLQ